MLVFLLCLYCFASPLAPEPPRYTQAELLGDFDPAQHPAFRQLASRYTNRSDAYLREEVYAAFQAMWTAAKADGIQLQVISATRSRAHQKGIWNRKWLTFGGAKADRAERILQYSSMPGTSRHHWGTDFDLNALENSYFESDKGAAIYVWLCQNAGDYGFFQPYTTFNNYRDQGYREEKWHWSYYPTASRLQRAYRHLIDYRDLLGFRGDEAAWRLRVINNYVDGVEVPLGWQP